MGVEVIVAARVRGKRRTGPLRHLPGGWSAGTLPVNVALVDHRAGLCLFDAGPGARVTTPGARVGWHPWLRLARFEATPTDTVADALARHGATRADVRWLVLSHLHVDHVGGVAEYPGAEVIVSRTEWDLAAGLAGRVRGYVPRLWPEGREPHMIGPDGPALGPFPGTYDVAGDGRLLAVPTPGHTPGHLGLIVRSAGMTVLLGGDLGATLADVTRIAPQVAAWCAAEPARYIGAHGESAGAVVPD